MRFYINFEKIGQLAIMNQTKNYFFLQEIIEKNKLL